MYKQLQFQIVYTDGNKAIKRNKILFSVNLNDTIVYKKFFFYYFDYRINLL